MSKGVKLLQTLIDIGGGIIIVYLLSGLIDDQIKYRAKKFAEKMCLEVFAMIKFNVDSRRILNSEMNPEEILRLSVEQVEKEKLRDKIRRGEISR